MAVTIFGALKAFLEGQGLGISVYKDAPPAKVTTKFPYCTVTENIALTVRQEDGTILDGVEIVQLDLWQQWRDSADKSLESPTLPDAITQALEGAQLPTAPKHVYGVLQKGRIRTLDRDARIVHHAYTLDIVRAI